MKDTIIKIIGCTLVLLGMILLQGLFERQHILPWKSILIVLPICVASILLGTKILVWSFKRYPLKEEDY